MAPQARVERYEENPVKVPFEFKAELPDQTRVALEISTDRGKTWEAQPEEVARCSPPNTKEIFRFNWEREFEEGTAFRYRYRLTTPAGASEIRPKRAPGYIEKVAVPEPEASPSPTASIPTIQKRLKNKLGEVLKSLRSAEQAGGVEALVEEIQDELEALNVKDMKPPFAIKLLREVIAEDEAVPAIIKNTVKNGEPTETYGTLVTLLKKAGRRYHKQVFLNILKNKKARELFGLKPGTAFRRDNPLGKAKYNKLFFAQCARHGDISTAAPYFGAALASMDEEAKRNPKTAAQKEKQTKLLRARLKLAEKIHEQAANDDKEGFLKDVPSERKGRILDAAIYAAILTGGFLTGTFWAPVAVTGAKAAFHSLTGAGTGDFFTERGFLAAAKGNNIISQMLKVKGSSFEVMKARFGDMFRRTVPGYSVFSKQRPEGFTEAANEDLEDAESSEKPGEVTVLKEACEAAAH